MSPLRFRLPGRARSLSDWLASILPGVDRPTRRNWVEKGRILVGGVRVDRPGVICAPGALVEIEAVPEVSLSSLGFDPRRLSTESAAEWFAWVDEPPWFGGTVEIGGALPISFLVEERDHGLARLALSGGPCTASQVCDALSESGMPVVGDLWGGGLARPGGPVIAATRVALTSARTQPFTGDPAWPEATADGEPLVLRVSRQAARALERGHPWVLPDPASDSATTFRPGSEVRVEDRRGRVLGWAWTEGDERLAARMSASGVLEHKAIASIESRVARALGRRRRLFAETTADRTTDCFRLIHGEADGLPGLFVDRLGPLLRVLATGRASDAFRQRTIDALRSQMPTTPQGDAWSVIELRHLHTAARGQPFDRVRWVAGGPEALEASGVEAVGAGFWVEERGLRFSVDPGWDSPRRTRPGFGLFPDQRENRERLVRLAARGGHWLNLFAHTGAFSAALLAAGAESVVSVDLSRPYLLRLEANLEANRERGVDPERHRTLLGDGRRVVESLEPAARFAGIVLDPPTAASAGRRFWSVRQDLEPLLGVCVERLADGGALLVTQNAKGARLGLEDILERISSEAGRIVRSLTPAGPGVDYPSLAGFPEGEAFEGWLLEIE